MIVYNNSSAWTKVFLGSVEFPKVYSSLGQVFPEATPPTPIAVTSVTVSPTTANVEVGSAVTLTATVLPSDADNKSVTWSSSDNSIVSVNSGGVATALASGSATVTVTTVDGGYTAQCAFTVTEPPTAWTKVTIRYSDGSVSGKDCDASSVLAQSEVSSNTKYMSSVTVGDCVTSVGDNAFFGNNCWYLSYVSLPSGLTYVGTSAFRQCHYLTNITIPSGVTSIGESAFRSCESLTSIDIPNSVTSISSNTFNSCVSLTSVTIPNSVTIIGNEAFYTCTSLTSISIPNSVTSIYNYAFARCSGLTSATIGSGVTTIDFSAFSGCTSLTSITIPNSVTSIGSRTFENCTSLTSATIGNGITSIGEKAFSGCTALNFIEINAVTPPTLASMAFYSTNNCPIYVPCDSVEAYKAASGWINYASRIQAIPDSCYKLKSLLTSSTIYTVDCNEYTAGTLNMIDTNFSGQKAITVSASVGSCVTIIDGAFSQANNLTSVTLPNTITTLGEHSFYMDRLLAVINLQDCTSLTTIGKEAFSHCQTLTSITIPNSVTSIGYYAFEMCSGLTSINIPSGITSINENVFSWCTSLTSITIPSGVTSIGEAAFNKCNSLTSITIPNSVTSIGYGAFMQCTSLTSLTCLATTPPTLGSNAFYSTSDCPIYVPSGSVDAYKGATNWSGYKSRIQAIPNS